MQVIKPTHLCDIGNQIPHCILLASIKWVKLLGLWSVFYQLERRLREALLRPIICHHEIEAYQPQTSIILSIICKTVSLYWDGPGILTLRGTLCWHSYPWKMSAIYFYYMDWFHAQHIAQYFNIMVSTKPVPWLLRVNLSPYWLTKVTHSSVRPWGRCSGCIFRSSVRPTISCIGIAMLRIMPSYIGSQFNATGLRWINLTKINRLALVRILYQSFLSWHIAIG